MGKLPILVCPRDTFACSDGQEIEIRGLSRAEAIATRALGREGDKEVTPDERAVLVEIYCICHAVGVSEAEARDWHSVSPSGDVERLVDAIATLSGLNSDVGKDDAGGSPLEKSTESTTS